MLLRDMRLAPALLLSSALLAPALSGAAPAMGTIVVLDAPDGQAVTVDGAVIGQTPLPGPWTVAPGAHEVAVGDRAQTVQVAAGKQAQVRYGGAPAPKVEAKPAVEPAVRAASAPFPVAKAGYVGAGIGVAAIGAGVFFGLQSSDDPSESERSAVFANICYGVGGVLLLGGAAMIFWGSDGPFTASVTPGGAVLGGRF